MTITSMWALLGNSWYDSPQAMLVNRYSRGIDGSVAHTWSKNLANTYNDAGNSIFMNDPFNRRNAKSGWSTSRLIVPTESFSSGVNSMPLRSYFLKPGCSARSL